MKLTTIAAAAACSAGVTPVMSLAQLAPGWTYSADRITMASPRLADVDGDGVEDIVLGTMGPPSDPYNSGWVGVLDMAGEFLPGFPIELPAPVVGSLAIGDIDDDGAMEIVATSWSFLWAWNHDGTEVPGFPIPTGVSSGIPPALADLDADGGLDIIVAQGSALYVYDGAGAVRPGWPVAAPQNFQAPAVGDIDGDGALEIVAGTWDIRFPDVVPHELHALEADGASLPGFPITGLGSIRGPVSLGDVDGDGGIEIVARSGDDIYIWTHEGDAVPPWPVAMADSTRNAATAIGDIDDDGDLEILIGGFRLHARHHTGARVAGWPVQTGTTANMRSSPIIVDLDVAFPGPEVFVKIHDHLVGFTADGDMLPWLPYFVSDRTFSTTFDPSPAVGDVNGDGAAELVYVSNAGEIHFLALDHAFDPARAPWPMAQQNARNTCFLPPAEATCYADCDESGSLDFFDFLCFQNRFAGGDPRADCDDSGALDFFDFLCFQNAFAAGCP